MFRLAASIWLKYFDIETSETIRSKISLRREMCIEQTFRPDNKLHKNFMLDPCKYNLSLSENNYFDFYYDKDEESCFEMFIKQYL